jgi:hypothetical protein
MWAYYRLAVREAREMCRAQLLDVNMDEISTPDSLLSDL